MHRVLIVLSLLLVIPSRVNAQDYKKISDVISYGTVTTNIVLDSIHSLKCPDSKVCFRNQAFRLGLTVTLSQIVKKNVHKMRPDGSDDMSFWSEHTAIAAASQGYNFYIGVPISVGTGGLRISAQKHDWIDVSAGFLAGSLIGLIR